MRAGRGLWVTGPFWRPAIFRKDASGPGAKAGQVLRGIRTWMVFCFAVVAGALLGTAGFWAAIVEPICGKKMSIVSGRMILCMFTSPLLHAGRRESIRAAALRHGVLDRCRFGTTTQMPAPTWPIARHPDH